jgi:hypothetical protein
VARKPKNLAGKRRGFGEVSRLRNQILPACRARVLRLVGQAPRSTTFQEDPPRLPGESAQARGPSTSQPRAPGRSSPLVG